MRRVFLSVLVLTSLCHFVLAKDKDKDQANSSLVIYWPVQDNAILKLTFSRFQNLASYEGQTTWASNVIVQNVSPKAIPKASFSVALLNKDHVRVGSGTLAIDDLNAGQSAAQQFLCESIGFPTSLTISARIKDGAPVSSRMVPMTVISVPAGASLKVDGKDAGQTPTNISVGVGTHQLELEKEGFALATAPLEVAPDEAPGGSISITLGGLTDDTLELRDGSIITGAIVSVTMESVVIQVNGQQQTLDRNKVKKMFLVERIVTHPESAPSAQKQAAHTPSSDPNH